MDPGRNLLHEKSEALKLVEYHTSPRSKRLGLLKAYVKGTQYEGRPNFFNDKFPIFERAPCVVYNIVDVAIKSFIDLTLGDTRFPKFNFEPDDEVLKTDQADQLTSGVEQTERAAQYKVAMRTALYDAMACGTTCLIGGIIGNRLSLKVAEARWCTPDLDDDGTVKSLVIEFPYIEEYQDGQGEWHCKAMLYRREITDSEDITYKPQPAEQKKPVWSKSGAKVIDHNLGFCPIIWYTHMHASVLSSDIDGIAHHEGLEDEIYAMNLVLSQHLRAALYAGDPQWTFTGVEPGFNPSGKGRQGTDKLYSQPFQGPPRAEYIDMRDRISEGDIKKGPGNIWFFPDKEVKAQLHTLPDGALESVARVGQDLRAKLSEALSVVFIDPEQVKFASQITGKALETLRERQINRCDQIRDDVAPRLLLPTLNLLLRLIAKTPSVLVGNAIKKMVPLLKKFGASLSEGTAEASMHSPSVWLLPEPNLVWGNYFKDDPAEQAQIITMTLQVFEAGLILRKTAVEKIRPYFNYANVEAYMELLKQEREEIRKERLAEADEIAKIQAKVKPQSTKPPTK